MQWTSFCLFFHCSRTSYNKSSIVLECMANVECRLKSYSAFKTAVFLNRWILPLNAIFSIGTRKITQAHIIWQCETTTDFKEAHTFSTNTQKKRNCHFVSTFLAALPLRITLRPHLSQGYFVQFNYLCPKFSHFAWKWWNFHFTKYLSSNWMFMRKLRLLPRETFHPYGRVNLERASLKFEQYQEKDWFHSVSFVHECPPKLCIIVAWTQQPTEYFHSIFRPKYRRQRSWGAQNQTENDTIFSRSFSFFVAKTWCYSNEFRVYTHSHIIHVDVKPLYVVYISMHISSIYEINLESNWNHLPKWSRTYYAFVLAIRQLKLE